MAAVGGRHGGEGTAGVTGVVWTGRGLGLHRRGGDRGGGRPGADRSLMVGRRVAFRGGRLGGGGGGGVDGTAGDRGQGGERCGGGEGSARD